MAVYYTEPGTQGHVLLFLDLILRFLPLLGILGYDRLYRGNEVGEKEWDWERSASRDSNLGCPKQSGTFPPDNIADYLINNGDYEQ